MPKALPASCASASTEPSRLLYRRRDGFTLVELAIVLVIIGLIIAGILVGRDMIRGAEMRSTIGQMEKFDAAANTFRIKYGGLPGDLLNPAGKGLYSTGSTGAAGLANGDSILQGGLCSNVYGLGGEALNFWTHLAQAGLISAPTTTGTDYSSVAPFNVSDSYLPRASLGNGERFHVTGIYGRNYYELAFFTNSVATTCDPAYNPSLTPHEAYTLDLKMDDGNAYTGKVVSISPVTPYTAGANGSSTPTASMCINSTPPGNYAVLDAIADTPGCELRINTSF